MGSSSIDSSISSLEMSSLEMSSFEGLGKSVEDPISIGRSVRLEGLDGTVEEQEVIDAGLGDLTNGLTAARGRG